jgi:hypothetical protein
MKWFIFFRFKNFESFYLFFPHKTIITLKYLSNSPKSISYFQLICLKKWINYNFCLFIDLGWVSIWIIFKITTLKFWLFSLTLSLMQFAVGLLVQLNWFYLICIMNQWFLLYLFLVIIYFIILLVNVDNNTFFFIFLFPYWLILYKLFFFILIYLLSLFLFHLNLLYNNFRTFLLLFWRINDLLYLLPYFCLLLTWYFIIIVKLFPWRLIFRMWRFVIISLSFTW